MDLRRPAGALFEMSLVAAVDLAGVRAGDRRRRPRADLAERGLADHAGADLAGRRLAADHVLAAAPARGADVDDPDDPADRVGRARRRSCSARSRRCLQLCGVAFILVGVISVAVRRRAACASCWLTAAASSSTAGSRRRWRSSAPTSTTRCGRRASCATSRSCVLAAHRAFVEAGAEIVISASYQAPDELLAESVRIARARGRARRRLASRRTARRWRAAQEYTGDYEVPAGWHERRAARCCSRPSPTSSRSRPSRAPTRRPRSSALAGRPRLLGHVHLPRRRADLARRAHRGRRARRAVAAGRRGRRQLHRAGARRRAARTASGPSPTCRSSPTRTPAARTTRRRRRGAARRRPGAATPRSSAAAAASAPTAIAAR